MDRGHVMSKPFQFTLRQLLGLVTAFAVVCSLAATISSCKSRIERGVGRIEIGMDRRQVEAILGRGDAVKGSPTTVDFSKPLKEREVPVVTGDEFLEWDWSEGVIVVGFRKGKVCDKYYWERGL
jgi:hypothetical protein